MADLASILGWSATALLIGGTILGTYSMVAFDADHGWKWMVVGLTAGTAGCAVTVRLDTGLSRLFMAGIGLGSWLTLCYAWHRWQGERRQDRARQEIFRKQ